MNADKIAEDLVKSRKRYKDYDVYQLTAYDNAVTDLLDAIGEAHPNLVYDMHKIGQAIDEAVDALDIEVTKEL